MDEYAGKEIKIIHCHNYFKGKDNYACFRPNSVHKVMKAPPGKTNSQWYVWVKGELGLPAIILNWEYKFYKE